MVDQYPKGIIRRCFRSFLDIVRTVEQTLERVSAAPLAGLDDVHAVDSEAREVAAELAATY